MALMDTNHPTGSDALPPAPGARISPTQLQDIVGFLNESFHPDKTGECLWALHQELLMGSGEVLVNSPPAAKAWALRIPTTQGDRFVHQDLSLLDAPPPGEWNITRWKDHGELNQKRVVQNARGMLACTGVGLLFTSSRPLDDKEGEDLVEAMWGFSCHPYLGRRILADLNTHGQRAATVMQHLLHLIPDMVEQFRPFGISVKRCWPMPSRGKPQVPEGERDVPMPRRIHKPR